MQYVTIKTNMIKKLYLFIRDAVFLRLERAQGYHERINFKLWEHSWKFRMSTQL